MQNQHPTVWRDRVTVTEAPPLSTCTVQIERRGGRGEAGARALERHLRDNPGVHDVDVSFRAGTVRITYDESHRCGTASERSQRPRRLDPGRVRDGTRRGDLSLGTQTGGSVRRSDAGRDGDSLATGLLGGPPLLLWAGYGVAYVFGGWYGLKGAIQTLRHRAVDIDLLMIVAALGALSIGAPFEGAMLLFLFSLSNTLQHYAIGRSRRAIKSLVEMRPDEAQVLRGGEKSRFLSTKSPSVTCSSSGPATKFHSTA